MRRPFSKDPQVESSLRHSVRDAVAHSAMAGAGESFFSAFALFLKATNAQIALLASIPPLLASLAQLVSVWCGRFVQRRQSIILFGAYVQCFLWLPLLALPLLFPEHAVTLFIVVIVFYQASSHLIAPQWSSLMGDLVPQRKRGRYFGMRTRAATVASFSALVIAGSVLHWFDAHGATVTGFIVIFSFAAIARLVSAYHLSRMYEPPRTAELPSTTFNLKAWTRRFRNSPAVRFSMFYACFQAAVSISAPFFTVYMLRELNFSYLEFMCVTATSVLLHFTSLPTWGRISDAWGNRVILVFTGAIITTFPLLWLVSTNIGFIIGVQMLSGICWSGFSLATNNFLFDTVPAAKRCQYLAFHNVLGAVAVCVGALVGGTLATTLPHEITLGTYHFSWLTPLYGLFLISSLARIVVAVLCFPHLREVRDLRTVSMSVLLRSTLPRMQRLPRMVGMLRDVCTRRFVMPRQ
jgi:MFS family permease